MAPAELTCTDAIGTDPPYAQMTLVLGVVGLPASPGHDSLQVSTTGSSDPAVSLFAKTGLVVRAGASFTISIPAEYADRARLGWGNPGQPTTRLSVGGCPPSPGGGSWLDFAGGYWASSPMCLPIVIATAGRDQRVLVGVGTTCPGQRVVPSS